MILSITFYIFFIINCWFEIRHNIHIFQLNYYKIPVQLKWYKKNLKKNMFRIASYLILIIALIAFSLIDKNEIIEIKRAVSIGKIIDGTEKISKIIGIIIFIINSYLLYPKNVKIKLVYTNRIKLLLCTIFILISIPIIILKSEIILPIILLLIPILVILGDLIDKPINLQINKKYIKKAKEKIDEMEDLIVIGVTGSYGKTSVKNYLYTLLSEKYNVLMTPLNYNTTLGVCRTILENLKPTHNVFICEMGATKQGDIEEICKIVHPKYGIITSIGEQHLESFKTIENIIKTKFELEDNLTEDGIIFLNYDNKNIKNRKNNRKTVTYGINNKEVDYLGENIKFENGRLKFSVNNGINDKVDFSTELLGTHNVLNILGCIAIANELGIKLESLTYNVKKLKQVEHRQELKKIADNYYIIDDAYNSNPAGAKSALKTLSLFDAIKILITPGMVELGEKQYECNFEFGKEATKVCDKIILVGKEQTKPIIDGIKAENYNDENVIIVEDVKKAIEISRNIESNGKDKVVLIENDLPDNY